MSAELLIISITGAIAVLTYIVKHCRKSECWSKENCFSIRMDSASTASETSTPAPPPPAPPPSPVITKSTINVSSVV